MAEPLPERSVVDRTANLQQQVRATSRPSHLLRFVHPLIDEKIGSAFG
jgi:hypothetical protein